MLILMFSFDIHVQGLNIRRLGHSSKEFHLSLRLLAPFTFLLFSMFPMQADAIPESFADLAAEQKPAVVNISTTKINRSGMMQPPGFPPGSPFEDFFRDFFPPQQSRESHALGSGFIISSDGYVVTNNHVVEGADEIIVKTSSGEELKAEIIGTDPKLDLALLKISNGKLPKVRLGDSDKLRVGDWVVAIGNPFGLEQTVTAGIVSAKGRVIGAGPYDSFIQTDAAINPGNSGGPLFNVRGEVVGINTAIYSRSGGNNGIGFTIPINLARPIIEELKETGHVRRAKLGVHIDAVSKDTMQALGLKNTQGALVRQVEAGSAAEKAGIQAGDVIIRIDGEPIKRVHDLPIRIARHKAGDRVRVEILRNGKRQMIPVTVEEMADEVAMAGKQKQKQAPALGLALSDLTGDIAKKLHARIKAGAVVQRVRPGSVAARAGIEKGDVIYRINRRPVNSVADFNKLWRAFKPGEVLQVMLDRHGNQVFIMLRLPQKNGRN